MTLSAMPLPSEHSDMSQKVVERFSDYS